MVSLMGLNPMQWKANSSDGFAWMSRLVQFSVN